MKRKPWALVLGAFLILIPLAYGDEEFDQLMSKYFNAMENWYSQMNQVEAGDASDTPKEAPHPAESFAPLFKAHAIKHSGKTEAIPSLMWLLKEGSNSPLTQEGKTLDRWALEELTNCHAGDPLIGKEISSMVFLTFKGIVESREAMKAFYKRVMEENKDPLALSWASFNLGFEIYHEKPDPADKTSINQEEALKWFRHTVKEYEGTDAAVCAACYIYELEHLQISMKAPDIKGTDVEGKEIRLSQFLGRVVVIDFWGTW